MHSGEVITILGALDGARKMNAAEISAATGLAVDGVKRRLPALVRQGLAARAGGAFKATQEGSAVAAAAGAARPARDTIRQRMWTALRNLKKATIAELLTLASTTRTADRAYAQHFLRVLQRAGYVVAKPRRNNGPITWVLVKAVGARAPTWSRRTRTLADPNTGEVHRL